MWFWVLIITSLLTSQYLVGQLRRWLKSRRFARQYGTVPPIQLASVNPGGGSYYKETMQAFKESRLLELTQRRHEAGGHTFRAQSLGIQVIDTSEPENVKAILATNFDDYCLGFRQAALGPFIGKGIFTTDAKEWEFSRGLIRPNFTRVQVSDLSIFEKHINQLLNYIPSNKTVDLQDLFFKLSCTC